MGRRLRQGHRDRTGAAQLRKPDGGGRTPGVPSRVEALQAVAAATRGEILLEINPLHPADHKISRNGTGLPVSAVTLDELVQGRSSPRPALVKIDVQGAEMMVIEGANGILSQAGPALFVELHEAGLNSFGSLISEILGHLAGYGYEPYWLARKGPPRRTNAPEIAAAASRSGYVDVLFLKAPPPGRCLAVLMDRPRGLVARRGE